MEQLRFKLEDFFPIYTMEDEKEFYNSVPIKKEFDDARALLNEPRPQRGEQLKHQAFMMRFLSPHTPYDKMIAFHGLGSGKTQVLTSIAEYAKLIKSGELSNNKVIILTRNPTLRKNMINEIVCVATAGKYEPPLRDPKTRELLSKDTQRRRVEKAIGVEYEILTFTMFVKEIYNKSNEQLRAEYSNRYILIDEAHNIKLQPNKKSKDEDDILGLQLRSRGVSNYKEIHRLLHCITGCKILLLTATPMRDQPSEICNLLNLILPLEKQLNKKEFKNIFFDENKFKDEKKNEFKSYIRNRISYVRSSTTDINIVNEGVIDEGFKYTKTVLLDMDDFQDEKYKEAYKKDVGSNGELNVDIEVEEDDEEGSSGLWLNSRQASMFVPFDKVKLNDLIVKDRNNYRASDHLVKYLKKNGDGLDAMLKQLKKCSVKYWLVVRDLYKYPNQKFFIYSNIVKGSGALLLGAILEVFGFEHAPNIKEIEGSTYCQTQSKESKELPINENPNRMLVLTGSTLTSTQLDNMVNNIFNNKKNVYGDYIRVIIGSHIIGEGVSFKHIRRIYVLTPGWNSATTEQAIGRGIRYKSHEDLKPNERNVSIYRVAVQPVIEIDEKYGSIDSQMYKISEDKDIRIKQVERLMKEASIDCALNRSRNVLPTDKPNTKDCDYMECEYKCDLVDEKFYHSNWVGERIVDTYNLYYAEKEINIVKLAVRKAFGYKFAFDFEELYKFIQDDIKNIPSLVLARALDSMIVNNDTVYNKYGIVNYLREDRNMFFLVDDPLETSVFTSYYYSKDPSPEKSIGSYETILQYFQYDKIEDIINILLKNQKNERVLNSIFNSLSAEISQKFVEMFYIAKLKKSGENKELQEFILKKFNMFLKDVNGNIISNVNPGNIRVLEKGKYVWEDINEEQIEKLKSMKSDKLNELKNNPYRVYAVITDKYKDKKEVHKNLKLVEINEKKSYGGTSCSTTPYDLKTIIGLYYALVKKARELGEDLPSIGNKTYTLKDIRKFPNFEAVKKYIFDIKYINELREYITDTDLLKEFINRLSIDKEKKKLKKYITKDKLDEDDIITILKTVSDKSELITLYSDMSNTKFIDYIEEQVEKEINSLSEEVINTLGNLLDKKTTPEICGSMKEWFINNNLFINEADLNEV